MAEAINNGYLRHVDISYNSLNAEECEILAKDIKENHSLWGLHMIGNDCMVDSFGYIQSGAKPVISTRDILTQAIEDGRSCLSPLRDGQMAKIRSYQNCWVCEGWTEMKFEWKMGISSGLVKEPVYIHFDFDTYKPWLLEKDDEGTYYIYKMVPPGRSLYFYSLGGEEGEADVSKEQKVIRKTNLKIVKNILFKELKETQDKTVEVEYEKTFVLHKMNFVIATQSKVLDESFIPLKFEFIEPRNWDKIYTQILNERPRTPWSLPISIFKDYIIDTEAKLLECFEFDWSCMKFPKMPEQDMADIKETLRQSYKTM